MEIQKKSEDKKIESEVTAPSTTSQNSEALTKVIGKIDEVGCPELGGENIDE